MNRLNGKVAIVTGSSSGIGKAIALRFGEEGATVILAARRFQLCAEIVSRIEKKGGKARAIQTDITDEQQVHALMQQTVKQYGRLDILINNAGIFGGGAIVETDINAFDNVMATNLRGTFLCCHAGFQQMKEKKGGLIINMSSVAGVQAWKGTGTYSASKHGIMALTKSLADEGRAFNIKVSAICPAGVADELVDASPEEILQQEKINPYDIAETAIYLARLGPQAIVHQVIVDRSGADW